MRWPMSALLVAVVLPACAAQAPTGPAWPKAASHEADGGESLAPRAAAAAIGAAMRGGDERSADETFDELPVSPAAAAPSNGAVERPADPAAQPQPEEIQGEDIVIEVESD